MEASRALHAGYGRSLRRTAVQTSSISRTKKAGVSLPGVRALAEGIMLQAIEDLGDEEHRKESLRFFRGMGFDIWAGIAKLSSLQQLRLARLIAGADKAGGFMQKHRTGA